MTLKVLIACEESQTTCKAFRALGHEAYSCDIQDCSGGHPEWHLKQDVLPLLQDDWDLIIAHPPCTYMSKAGARWMYPTAGTISEERLQLARDAKAFFMEFWNCKCHREPCAAEDSRTAETYASRTTLRVRRPIQQGDAVMAQRTAGAQTDQDTERARALDAEQHKRLCSWSRRQSWHSA